MFTPIAPIHEKKTILREMFRGARKRAAAERPDAATHAARNFIDHIPLTEGAIISVYDAMKQELDPEPLVAALMERGASVALPVVERKKAPLVFRRYRPGDKLEAGSYGERIPLSGAETVVPDIVVVPLLAFTRDGGRLGYGGGYYDRTLQGLRKRGTVMAVGYAYGAQEVDALPLGPLDQKLDWIVTEREAIRA